MFPPSIAALTRKGSAFRQFAGLGVTAQSIVMAAIYAILKTGFAEDALFRGLIAGSLGRRMRLWLANLCQALIFHLWPGAIAASSSLVIRFSCASTVSACAGNGKQ